MKNTTHPSGLSMQQIDGLRLQARSAAERAYAPYSGFRVGAALLLEDGRIFTGCNLENASYRMTLCAEHVAIAKAVSEVGPATRIHAIAVDNLNNAGSFPCGPCRQALLEFGKPDMWIFAPTDEGPAEAPLADLLPFGFTLQKK